MGMAAMKVTKAILFLPESGFEIHVETGQALGGEAKLFEADFGDFELGARNR